MGDPIPLTHSSPDPIPLLSMRIVIVVVSSIIAAGYLFLMWRAVSLGSSKVATPLQVVTPASKESSQPYFFHNEYLSLNVPAEWKLKQLNGGVAIRKGNFILSINPRVEQVSGIKGGRFDEISRGARGVDLVVKYEPSFPCGIQETVRISERLERRDLFVSSDILKQKGQEHLCSAPTSARTVWYFSWVVERGGGYLGNLETLDSRFHKGNFFIRMTCDARDINDLPQRGSTKLRLMLQEMTDIVRSMIFQPPR